MLGFEQTMHDKRKYERGLELVPLLIHLPPISEDIEVGGRDTRDVIDENISKAQTVYNIIASTLEQNFKNRFSGQRHFGFEIVGVRGFVHIYALAPADMIPTLEQALTSAYPSTRLERAGEYNIFNEVGGINAVVGGQMRLKKEFSYPIATYQESKRDGMQSILNALSTLSKEDGAVIQLLFRPTDDGWRKKSSSLASMKRKGGNKLDAASFAKDFFTAFTKAPESKSDDKSKDISSLDQSVIDSIEEKTRHAGFEVTIRLVASSNIMQNAQAIISNVASSFSLFDAPGRNGFKYVPAKSVDDLVTNYAMRFFPYHKKPNILNSVELATLFHFPDQRGTPTTQLERQESKQVDGPRNMPDDGLLLGYNVFRGAKKPIRLSPSDRQRHMYAVGQTGTGKSTFLENLALQDMTAGNGFAFVDPHGDTAEKLLSMVPKERTEDVIYFCPSDMDYPMGMNLFEFQNPDEKDFLIQEVINMLYKLYDPQHQGIIGPRYESIFRNAALTVMADPEGGTFIDIPKLFRDPQFVKQKLQHVTDPNVREFWEKEMPQSQRSNEFGEVVSWFVSKFGAFLSNEMMRNIIGQTKSSFNLREIMDNKKILLVNLSKGRTGDLNSKLLGMMFVMKFQAAAMSRANVPESERVDFALYVDEFQNFSTDSFATILSEARKFHLNLIVANQFTTQLTEEIRDAVFGNIGTVVCYRIGQNDVDVMSRYFQPQFDGDDLLRIPNFNTVVRTMVRGVPTQPFSMAALPSIGTVNSDLAKALKQLSAAKYGKKRAVVEQEIFERLKTQTPPTPSANPFAGGAGGAAQARPPRPTGPQPFQSPFGNAPAMSNAPYTQPQAPPRPATPPQPQSFLDGWTAKQQAMNNSQQSMPNQSVNQPMPQPIVSQNIPSVPSPVAAPAPVAPSVDRANSMHDVELTIPRPDKPIATATGNVSSGQLDADEVSTIAAELKKSIGQSSAGQNQNP